MVKHTHYQAALDALLEMTGLLADDMERDLARRGLTRSRASIVWLVALHGPMTQRALADALRVSPRNITGLIDALVATGFVRRDPHPTDRRATLVVLTDQGAAVAEGLRRDHAELADQLFGALSAREFAGLHRGLVHVRDVLRRLIAEQDEAGPPA